MDATEFLRGAPVLASAVTPLPCAFSRVSLDARALTGPPAWFDDQHEGRRKRWWNHWWLSRPRSHHALVRQEYDNVANSWLHRLETPAEVLGELAGCGTEPMAAALDALGIPVDDDQRRVGIGAGWLLWRWQQRRREERERE